MELCVLPSLYCKFKILAQDFKFLSPHILKLPLHTLLLCISQNLKLRYLRSVQKTKRSETYKYN